MSIKGSKKPKVKVVYTEYLNLLKTNDMDIGAVTFKDEKKVIMILKEFYKALFCFVYRGDILM